MLLIGAMLCILLLILVVILVVKMWGESSVVVGRSRRDRGRLYAIEYRRWLEEAEELEFRDMIAEFGDVADETEDDWLGWLSFREEFGSLLYFYVDDDEEEDWDEQIRREMYGDIGKFFKGG